MNYKQIGKITHYFDKIGVAVLQMTDDMIKVGDSIRIGDESTGLEQQVDSMQVEHAQVNEAKAGDEVGLKVSGQVHPGNVVYKITE